MQRLSLEGAEYVSRVLKIQKDDVEVSSSCIIKVSIHTIRYTIRYICNLL